MDQLNNFYTKVAPNASQTCAIFEESWSSQFPPQFLEKNNLSGPGGVPLFSDSRISWLLERLGESVAGMKVLELGPLEGGHTYMLANAGARVLAVESNSVAYLKCLVARELLGYHNAEFQFGDFVQYMYESTEKFDLILASGVLYHMENPLELLQLCAERTDKLFLWTHYFDPEEGNWSPTIRKRLRDKFGKGKTVKISRDGQSVQVVTQQYLESLNWSGFCGGPSTSSSWMFKDDIERILRERGFTKFEVAFDEPNHQNGPSYALFAQK